MTIDDILKQSPSLLDKGERDVLQDHIDNQMRDIHTFRVVDLQLQVTYLDKQILKRKLEGIGSS